MAFKMNGFSAFTKETNLPEEEAHAKKREKLGNGKKSKQLYTQTKKPY